MKKVAKTAEHTIYQKRSGRYAVKNKKKQWVHGDDKAAVLTGQGLVKKPEPKAPAPAAPAEETAAEDTAAE